MLKIEKPKTLDECYQQLTECLHYLDIAMREIDRQDAAILRLTPTALPPIKQIVAECRAALPNTTDVKELVEYGMSLYKQANPASLRTAFYSNSYSEAKELRLSQHGRRGKDGKQGDSENDSRTQSQSNHR